MTYRISLHILATIWHLLLLALAISLRKNHGHYRTLIPVCLIAALFTASWALGLIFKSDFFMRLTWLGALWPAALLFFIRDMLELQTSKLTKIAIIALAFINTIGGMTPYCLVGIQAYEPGVVATYGLLEPFMRIGLLIQILWILKTVIPGVLVPKIQNIWSTRVALIFTIYGVCALFANSLLPLFGEYRMLEPSSYGSVVWTTFAVWCVFKDLHERNRALIELDILKKELINHVTHEFRTPLGAISSALEIAQTHYSKDKEKVKDYLKMIESNTQRLSHFVDELLDLAAIQQAKIRLNKNEVDLRILLERVIDGVRPLAEKNNTSLSVDGNRILCMCDEEKIEQVVGNLLTNAIKAAPDGMIEVKILERRNHAEIYVKDNGMGISQEHLGNIFSSFYRVAIKPSPRKGSGLGLAIAKGWVEAHGGRIWAESEGLGKGTKVTFTVPT